MKQPPRLVHNRKAIVLIDLVYVAVSIAIGGIFTVKAVELAYIERGYDAIGGEWLVFLLVLLVAKIIKQVVLYFIKIFKTSNKENTEEYMQQYKKTDNNS